MTEKTEHFSVYSFALFFGKFLTLPEIVFFNELHFGFRLFLDFVPFHTPYKAHVVLQQKQQLSAVITAGNKREVPKVFSVKLKMVRRRKIFIHRFGLLRFNFEEVWWKRKL